MPAPDCSALVLFQDLFQFGKQRLIQSKKVFDVTLQCRAVQRVTEPTIFFAEDQGYKL